MFKVDCHLIIRTDRLKYRSKCLESIISEPVNLFAVDGDNRTVSEARKIGFSCGNAEYITFVDDDDFVEAGAMQACVDVLDANPELVAVFTSERRIAENGAQIAIYPPIFEKYDQKKIINNHPYAHHIVIFRRKFYEKVKFPLNLWQTCGDQAMIFELSKLGGFGKVGIVGYNWRRRTKSACANAVSEYKDMIAHYR